MTFVWEHSDLIGDEDADRLAATTCACSSSSASAPTATRNSTCSPRTSGISCGSGTPRSRYDREATVHALVQAQASRTPDATAVIDASGGLTYEELLRRAAAVARALRERGVLPGDRVGVASGALRCPDHRSSSASSLAGAAYVPLDPRTPRAHRPQPFRRRRCAALTQASLRGRIPRGCSPSRRRKT
jgi:non-ribosomal peptide synthetase component F